MLLTYTFSIYAQRLLPLTVEQYLDERSYSERFMSQPDANESSRFFPSRMIDGREMVDAFIAIENEAVISMLQANGVNVNCLFDGFVTAQVPVDRLVEVSRLHGVTDVEISQKLTLCTDTTLSVTHVNQILDGQNYGLPQNYDGSGVIVGVIDIGFDYQHRAFRSNDDTSKTRIVRVYSTTDNTGHKAYFGNNMKLPGSVFMNDEIYDLTTDKQEQTHGTHTTSIAAGSHVNGYGGMAPGADIVMCAVSVLSGNMSAVEVANCVRYIDCYADSVGKPCVISISVSTPNGQHNGKDYLSKIVNQTMGPGRAFVISAGNNAGRKAYAHHLSTADSPLNLLFKYKNSIGGDSSYYYSGVISDIWMRQELANFYYKVHVIDLNTGSIVWETEQLSAKRTIDSSEFGGYYTCYEPGDTVGYFKCTNSYSSDGKSYRLSISIHNLISTEYTTVNGVKKSRYALGLSMYPRKTTPCEIDAWVCNTGAGFGTVNGYVTTMDGSSKKGFYAVSSDSCSIGTYAVGDSTISAGAYAARNSYYSLPQHRVVKDNSETVGDIASFSSYQVAGAGPTGEALPTICAPGFCVVAAGSKYSYYGRYSNYTCMEADGSFWGVMSGTSMAAPTVAGIIALWMQANPRLSVAEIKDIIAQTAIRDSYTTGPKHDRFGPNGKIDAMAGMRMVLDQIGFIPGDVNSDEFVDIVDLVRLIDYLLSGKEQSDFNVKAADVNNDGLVSIDDLTALIDHLMQH